MIESYENLAELLKQDQSRFTDGYCVYIENEEKVYSFKNGGWVAGYPASMTESSNGISVSLYDLNASVIGQMPAFTAEKLQEAEELIDNYEGESDYYMLLNNAIHYFTIFKSNSTLDEFRGLGDAVLTILQELGEIHAVDEIDGHIEAWVNMKNEEDSMQCFILFNCNDLIVEY